MVGLRICRPLAMEGKWPHYDELKPVLRNGLAIPSTSTPRFEYSKLL